MSSTLKVFERPELVDPVLIEGLPGMGYVANITALHLIRQLKAKKFAEVLPYQPKAALLKGEIHTPMIELYYHRSPRGSDLILLYGNAQPPTAPEQYELCNTVLDVVQGLGCKFILCIGGLRKKLRGEAAEVYCAATDSESINKALAVGVKQVRGRIFGSTGILLGLAKIREIQGVCLLAETSTPHRPDAEASKAILRVLRALIRLRVKLTNIDSVVDIIQGRMVLA